MADLSIFKLDDQVINIKDATARTDASNAKQLATTANGNASTALKKAQALEALSRLEVTYDSTKETMTFTTGTHNVA